MSTMKVTNLKHESSSVNNIVLNSDGSVGGELATTLASKLDVSGGKILQVVQTVKTDRFTTTSGTYTDITGYSASITPSSATSKVLVSSTFHYGQGATPAYARLLLLRDSTILTQGDASGSAARVTAQDQFAGSPSNVDVGNIAFLYLDSPSTTSSVTYKWQAATFSSRVMTFNGSEITSTDARMNTVSTITLMEVSA